MVVIAKAILRAFVWDEGQPMRALADALGVSPTTFYTTLRLAVQALMLVRRGKQSVETLAGRVGELRDRLARLERAYTTAQAEVRRLTKALAGAKTQVVTLQAEVTRLQAQWTVTQDRLIVVKMSGRCTVRSIVEVLEYGLGILVSVGYVQGVIAQAGTNAHTALERLLEAISLSGAICVDEVFFKELGRKMLGVVIVDPLSGLILRLQRCSEARRPSPRCSNSSLRRLMTHFEGATGITVHRVLPEERPDLPDTHRLAPPARPAEASLPEPLSERER